MVANDTHGQDHPGLDEPATGLDTQPASVVTGTHRVRVDYAPPRDWVKRGMPFPSDRTISVTAERLGEKGTWEPLVQSSYTTPVEDPAQDQAAFHAIMYSDLYQTTLEFIQGRTWRLTASGGGVILAKTVSEAMDKLLSVCLYLAAQAIEAAAPPAQVTSAPFTVPDNPRTTADYYSHVAPADKYAWLGEARG